MNLLDPEDEPRWLRYVRTSAEVTLIVASGVLELADILDHHRDCVRAGHENDQPLLTTWRQREEERP